MSSLTTIEKVKAYLGSKYTDTTDVFLEDIIAMQSAYIEEYCNRQFEIGSYTELYNVNHIICPNQYPIKSVEKIEVIYKTNATEITRELFDFILHNSYVEILDNKYITLSGKIQYCSNDEKTIRMSYTAGYDDGQLPTDLGYACTILSVLEYLQSRDERIGIESEREGDVQYTYSKQQTPERVLTILNKYKRKVF